MNKLSASRALFAANGVEPVSVPMKAVPVALTAAQLHERYLENVFQYVARRISRRSEAEDITAEVFAAAFSDLHRFKGDLPLAWLLGIARRKVADSLRRSARRKETLASELAGGEGATDALIERAALDAPTPEQIVQREEARQHIRALVSALPADQREALLLQYVEELSAAEIAIVMGKSAKAVNSLLQRARAGLYRTGSDYFLPASFSETQPAIQTAIMPETPSVNRSILS